jgi:HEAT repeat protein
MTTCLLFVSLLAAQKQPWQQELPAGHTSTRAELPQPRPLSSDPVVESSRDRMKQARDLGKQGSDAIPQLVKLYDDANIPVRVEVIHAIAEIGGPRSLDPLVKALGDPDAEIQIRATDGLVNFYLPGYLKTGLSAKLKRVGSVLQARFTENETSDIVPGFVQAREDVVTGLAGVVQKSTAMESRANAARALGILRGRGALPVLVDALRSKEDLLMYESLVAIQKIHDPASAPRIAFLLRDLNERIQIKAIETTGMLGNKEALRDLGALLDRDRTLKVKRAALGAVAMLADESSRPLFTRFLADRDEGMRAGAAEGLGRLRQESDVAALEKAFADERKTSPRLSLAFALVLHGKIELSEFSPLRYLISNLNSKAYRGVAQPFLIETSRDVHVLYALHRALTLGVPGASVNREERTGLAQVLAVSGDAASVPILEAMSKELDPEVASEALRSLRTLRTRLP